jgi:hypothetical protein
MGYYLADRIYPSWSSFVKTISNPSTKKQAEFSKSQEACQNDIDRAFDVFQARFAIVRGSSRFWDKKTLNHIMSACVILHNMIIENERDMDLIFSMTMLVAVLNQRETLIGSTHFFKPAVTSRTTPLTHNFVMISSSIIGKGMSTSSLFYAFDLHVCLQLLFAY